MSHVGYQHTGGLRPALAIRPAPSPRASVAKPLAPLRRRSRRSGRGFTLIEAALTTVIVGTGVLSIVAAQQAYHRKNDWAQRTGTAALLANELRELTLTLPLYDPVYGASQVGAPSGTTVQSYNNVMDFAGTVAGGYGAGMSFSPPINALRQQVMNMNGWTQQIKVENVLPGDLGTTFTQPLGTTDLARVTVTVTYQGPSEAAANTIGVFRWVVGSN
jgi:hypothetical protein